MISYPKVKQKKSLKITRTETVPTNKNNKVMSMFVYLDTGISGKGISSVFGGMKIAGL